MGRGGVSGRLEGEEIPIGARILAAVDCLDALASDRQYRKALPLDEAMQMVEREAGKSFDPKVVEILKARYVELEERARSEKPEPFELSMDLVVERGAAPAAGYAEQAPASLPPKERQTHGMPLLDRIASAREEAHGLYEISESLGSSLSLDETFSVLALRLVKLVPYDAVAVYLRRGERLTPEFVSGENSQMFSSLEIPLGQGLSGWVAETGKPIVNGNPSVEPGYTSDPHRFSTLRSALSVPLDGAGGTLGVLALYRAERDAFTRDNLRIVQVIAPKLALVVENSLRFRRAQNLSQEDAETGLANTRGLFARLDAELARARRQNTPLGVVAAEIEGFAEYRKARGTGAADRLLAAVAEALRSSGREYDLAARLGTAEFVVVAPGLEERDLAARAERLREACEAAARMNGAEAVRLAAGWAHFPASAGDAEELLAEADRRLHRSKAQRPRPSGARAAAERNPAEAAAASRQVQ